jgi:hypothetical protein
MSWSRSFESLEDFMSDRGTPSLPADLDLAPYIVACETAERIIESRVVGGNGSLQREGTVQGKNDKDFRVTLSGHTNPNHEPVKGWANDTLTVTVSQK